MSFILASPQVSQSAPDDPPPADVPTATVDHGLRSVQGIRWLLLVGASVVAVSVVRLVAARWGDLPLAAQFLVLAVGALAVFAAGDVIRHRLRLPAAGSALLFLFAAIVPLWTWGAAALDLLAAPFGWPVLIVSLVALGAALGRTLRRTLDYRGFFYPAALGVLLTAMPVLPWMETATAVSKSEFFLGAALVLGLLLRAACRHVNRFFFHRDRGLGRDRALHFLPFAMASLVYGAAMALLGTFPSHFAVMLVFVGLALVDTGEEYYRALVKALGKRPQRWPGRSVGLLAVGFATMAAALPLSIFDDTGAVIAVVSSVAFLRLLAWGLRFRSAFAHGTALLTGIIAYHAVPVLVPQAVKDLFQLLMGVFGIERGSPAVVSLADLGLLASLLALAAVLRLWRPRPGRDRPRLTPAMDRVHGIFIALNASLLLLIGLTDPVPLRSIASITALLLAVGVVWQRRHELLPVLYQALVIAGLAWTWKPAGGYWHAEAAVAVGAINVVFLAAGAFLLRTGWLSRARDQAGVVRLLTFPVLFSVLASVPLMSSAAPAVGGTLALLAAATCALIGILIYRETMFHATLLAAAAAFHFWGLDAALVLVLAAVAETVLAEALARRGRIEMTRGCRPIATMLGGAAGWMAIYATLTDGGSPWLAILPGFLASLLFVLMASSRTADPADDDPGPRIAMSIDRGDERLLYASLAMGLFAVSLIALVDAVDAFAGELLLLGPGCALLGFAGLMRERLGERWSLWLFTLGAGCLYAMPVLGLLDELGWTWQIVLLLLAVAFGAASFRLRSRSLLIVSTGALVTDLGFFLIQLRATDPMLLWAAGIVFGLGLMALAAFLEHRRELLLQHLRVWGRELRSWA